MEDLITTFQDLAVGLFAGMSTLAHCVSYGGKQAP